MSGGSPYLTRPVPPGLRPYVGWMVAYDLDLGAPGVHRGLPSTALTLVLPVGDPLEVSWSGRPASRGRWQALASGLHTTPAEIHHQGRQSGVQLSLTTAGARALLGESAADLANVLVDLADLRGTTTEPRLRQLPERLHDASSWAERLAVVERTLMAALARHGAAAPRAEVGHALGALTGGTKVRDVADEVGWSRRHLGTLVRAESGLTPKEYQRVARFERAHRRLRHTARTGTVRLAALAADLGYADQAHLTREWAVLAGCTPRDWLRTEFPFLQSRPEPDGHPGDDGHRDPAGSGRH